MEDAGVDGGPDMGRLKGEGVLKAVASDTARRCDWGGVEMLGGGALTLLNKRSFNDFV